MRLIVVLSHQLLPTRLPMPHFLNVVACCHCTFQFWSFGRPEHYLVCHSPLLVIDNTFLQYTHIQPMNLSISRLGLINEIRVIHRGLVHNPPLVVFLL
jgi:hypothetical protein